MPLAYLEICLSLYGFYLRVSSGLCGHAAWPDWSSGSWAMKTGLSSPARDNQGINSVFWVAWLPHGPPPEHGHVPQAQIFDLLYQRMIQCNDGIALALETSLRGLDIFGNLPLLLKRHPDGPIFLENLCLRLLAL
ncbi:uncharacterized protein BT62DRAFT_1010619 [Guyanagaster necrorhizus]|uniref:Uncharacterized protein n=1 Tax=Guyanagaster necrorhizus TaxID=856835 RepID=A0A9P7VKP4_9AGAR|nr:uncharacterized protein BT62DRAFT_1010619 [Guyanagaster necrorhizus MCA 3950]KAG7442343.1 hypothetical protein BT62DRAFT_1010619 [Guyanagaster necrorhizus MCA 3950]